MIHLILMLILGLGFFEAGQPVMVGFSPNGERTFITTGRFLTVGMVEQIRYGGSLTRNTVEGDCYGGTDHELFTAAGLGLKEYRMTSKAWHRQRVVTMSNLGKLTDDAKPVFTREYERVLKWLGKGSECRAWEVVLSRLQWRFGYRYRVT